jgi:hypothetical protein
LGSSALRLSSRGNNDHSAVRNMAHYRNSAAHNASRLPRLPIDHDRDCRGDGFGVNATGTNLFVVTLRGPPDDRAAFSEVCHSQFASH